ncbi:MAG: ParB/RepB/Spo0J family partition protein [Candidatus Pelagibacter bacterium]|nr:ParB/RepB/Spo0J family partition protein [Candidatus Pelagibacter bacterium]
MNPFKTKRGLGRGLSSLIGDVGVSSNKNKLSISSIIRNKFQPRKIYDKESLDELTNSIKERGIIQPIVVRRSEDQDDKFEIIAGERRWLAAQNAGLHEIPVVEVEANDLKSLEFAIVENVQRQDLNPIEEAQGYQKLIEKFNYDQEKVAKFIGKSRTHIANCLRLLSLPKDIILLIEEGKLSQGHAKILVGLENSYFLAKKIIDKKLSVRQSENLVRILKSSKKIKTILQDPNLKNFEESIQEKTGIKVSIRNKKNNTGQITFEYKDLDQLNRLIMVIKANY